MSRPVKPKTRVVGKLKKKLAAGVVLAKAKKRRKIAKAVATIKAKYTNLG